MLAVHTVTCEVRGGEFKACGLARHKSACKWDALWLEQDQAAFQAAQLPTNVQDDFSVLSVCHEVGNEDYPFGDHAGMDMLGKHVGDNCNSSDCVQDSQCLLVSEATPTVGLELNDIKTEYHPNSGNPPKAQWFVDFQQHASALQAAAQTQKPWKPFWSRLDFEVAELALNALLSKDLTETLINIVRHAACEQFTLTNYKDMQNTWDAASEQLT